MRGAEFNAFLSHLTTQEQVSASTQNQAVSALLFFTAPLLVGMWGNWREGSAPAGEQLFYAGQLCGVIDGDLDPVVADAFIVASGGSAARYGQG